MDIGKLEIPPEVLGEYAAALSKTNRKMPELSEEKIRNLISGVAPLEPREWEGILKPEEGVSFYMAGGCIFEIRGDRRPRLAKVHPAGILKQELERRREKASRDAWEALVETSCQPPSTDRNGTQSIPTIILALRDALRKSGDALAVRRNEAKTARVLIPRINLSKVVFTEYALKRFKKRFPKLKNDNLAKAASELLARAVERGATQHQRKRMGSAEDGFKVVRYFVVEGFRFAVVEEQGSFRVR